MINQICPHCDTEITQNDLDNASLKLKRRALEKEYRESKIGRRRENRVIAAIFGSLLIAASPFLVGCANLELLGSYLGWFVAVEIIFGFGAIFGVIYGLNIKLPELEDEYIKSRLEKNER